MASTGFGKASLRLGLRVSSFAKASEDRSEDEVRGCGSVAEMVSGAS